MFCKLRVWSAKPISHGLFSRCCVLPEHIECIENVVLGTIVRPKNKFFSREFSSLSVCVYVHDALQSSYRMKIKQNSNKAEQYE